MVEIFNFLPYSKVSHPPLRPIKPLKTIYELSVFSVKILVGWMKGVYNCSNSSKATMGSPFGCVYSTY